MLKALISISVSLVLVMYPYLVYQGVQQGQVWVAPMLIISFYGYQAFTTQALAERWLKISLILVLLTGLVFFQTLTAKLMPILMQCILLYFFGKTLLKNHAPSLIERFVRLEYEDFPVGIAEYCRTLTKMWTGYFAFNSVVCIVLAFYAPVSWWAIYTGVGMLLGTGVLMLGEYLIRPFLFPDLEIPDMKSSAKNMWVNGRKLWEESKNPNKSA
ncbi:MAG: hypothetical protein KAH08_00570 [Methylococcales bacterium]|nr:hypothetical protein [Methylococcales bacterium]